MYFLVVIRAIWVIPAASSLLLACCIPEVRIIDIGFRVAPIHPRFNSKPMWNGQELIASCRRVARPGDLFEPRLLLLQLLLIRKWWILLLSLLYELHQLNPPLPRWQYRLLNIFFIITLILSRLIVPCSLRTHINTVNLSYLVLNTILFLISHGQLVHRKIGICISHCMTNTLLR